MLPTLEQNVSSCSSLDIVHEEPNILYVSTIFQVCLLYLKFGINIFSIEKMKLRVRKIIDKLCDISWLINNECLIWIQLSLNPNFMIFIC